MGVQPSKDSVQANADGVHVVGGDFHSSVRTLQQEFESEQELIMSKQVPPRRTRVAEDYARKVRIEPPKETRQEDPRTKRLRKRPAG